MIWIRHNDQEYACIFDPQSGTCRLRNQDDRTTHLIPDGEICYSMNLVKWHHMQNQQFREMLHNYHLKCWASILSERDGK